MEVYTDQVMKAASVQDVNANASKGATLNEMLFNLLSTLAWSANRRGDQTDKHTRWLTAVTYFEQNVVGINCDEYFREFLLKFVRILKVICACRPLVKSIGLT